MSQKFMEQLMGIATLVCIFMVFLSVAVNAAEWEVKTRCNGVILEIITTDSLAVIIQNEVFVINLTEDQVKLQKNLGYYAVGYKVNLIITIRNNQVVRIDID